LIVAGGGGGASREGTGGGGAGGVLQGKTNLDSQSYSITVGDGGPGGLGATNPYAGTQGENSSAFGLTVIGGGPGVQQSTPSPDGGSGGGGSRLGIPGGQAVAGQGNNGGDGADQAGGGGGGGGSPGENGVANTKSGDGGQGILITITGVNQLIAGGGGGGARPAIGGARHGVGGLGGGGRGGTLDSNDADGLPGLPNTGSGGGASSGSANTDIGGKGGSGIVIVRYPRNSSLDTEPARTVVATQPNRFQTVQDGLVLNLDAGNPVSYPGTGTTWFNVGDPNLNATANSGTPSYSDQNGGIFTVNNNNWSVPDNTSLKLTGARTLIVWFKLSAISSFGIAGKADSIVNGLVLGYGWSGNGFLALAWNVSNSPGLARDPQRDINQWNYLVAQVNNNSERVIYSFDAQGVRTATAGASSQSWDNTLPFGIGAINGNGGNAVPSGSQFGPVFL